MSRRSKVILIVVGVTMLLGGIASMFRNKDNKSQAAAVPDKKAKVEPKLYRIQDEVIMDDVKIKFAVASIESATVTGQHDNTIIGHASESDLFFRIEIHNLNETRILNYNGFFKANRRPAIDNFGNKYSHVNFGIGKRAGGQIVGPERIDPGKTLIDVLVFERPMDKIQHVDISLPADAWGKKGQLTCRIPASYILNFKPKDK